MMRFSDKDSDSLREIVAETAKIHDAQEETPPVTVRDI
jgi:hypothetical protein